MNVIQPAASGAWSPGDPVGRRQFARLFTGVPLALETGARLGPIDVAYETWGVLTPARDNAVLVLHARHDHAAPVACAPRIAEQTRAVRIRILPRSYHLIAIDVERDIVAAEVTTFLRKHASARVSMGDLSCAM